MTAYYRIPSNFHHQDIHPFLQGQEGFFSAEGQPRYHHANPGSWHRRGYGSAGCKFLSFLKNIAFIVLSLFVVSTIVRFVLFLLAILFSPPLLFLFFAVSLLPKLATSCPRSSSWWSSNFNNNNRARPRARNFQRGNSCFAGQWPTQRRRNAAIREAQANRTSCRRVEQEVATQEDDDAKNDSSSSSSSNKQDQTENSSSNKNSSSVSNIEHRQTVIVYRDETDESLTLSLDVPGFGSENVRIRVKMEDEKGKGAGPNAMSFLEVHGERENRLGETFIVHEQFILPKDTYEVDDGISANLVDGVLEIQVTKKPVAQPRLIPISNNEKKDV